MDENNQDSSHNNERHDRQDIVRKLNRSGNKLSKGHRRIAEYIIEHYDKALYMTASKLGEQVGISESTVVRFADALGYEGYPQLQKALQELVRHRLTAVQRFEMSSEIEQADVFGMVLKADMQNIRQTIEEIDTDAFNEVIERLLKARNIYVIGVRAAAPLAAFLGYYLNYVFDNVHVASTGAIDLFESISRISAADVLVGISFPRYSSRTLEAMGFAKRCGAQVIAITDGPMSPLTDVASICLNARTDMATFVDSLAAPLSVINALIVSLGLRRKAEVKEHFNMLEDIWNEYHIYSEKDKE